MSNELNKPCEDNGMEHQLIIGYILEKNSLLERKNKIIMAMARAILMEKCLPKTLRAKAASTAIYLVN